MTDLEASENNSWHRMHTFLWRKLTILQIFANLAGAGIVTSYFMFFETDLKVQQVTNDLIVIGIMFVGLVIIATIFLRSWQKDLTHFAKSKNAKTGCGFRSAKKGPAKNSESTLCEFNDQPVQLVSGRQYHVNLLFAGS